MTLYIYVNIVNTIYLNLSKIFHYSVIQCVGPLGALAQDETVQSIGGVILVIKKFIYKT